MKFYYLCNYDDDEFDSSVPQDETFIALGSADEIEDLYYQIEECTDSFIPTFEDDPRFNYGKSYGLIVEWKGNSTNFYGVASYQDSMADIKSADDSDYIGDVDADYICDYLNSLWGLNEGLFNFKNKNKDKNKFNLDDGSEDLENIKSTMNKLKQSSKELKKANDTKSRIKANEDWDNVDSQWEQIAYKQVPDLNGFYTDYTMYENLLFGTDDDYPQFVCVFGDRDLYTPDDGDFDFETDFEDEAWEWFDSYNGFDEEDF